MSFVRACALSDLVDGEPASLEIGEQRVALVRDGDTVWAIRDECSHGKVLLSLGFFEADDCTLECIGHGTRFDLRTGNPLEPPASVPVPIYPTRIDGDDVEVDLDNPIKES